MAKLTTNFNINNESITSDKLKIGDMMVVFNTKDIILRIYKGFVSLTNPSDTWDVDTKLTGRKLNKGESITLEQE